MEVQNLKGGEKSCLDSSTEFTFGASSEPEEPTKSFSNGGCCRPNAIDSFEFLPGAVFQLNWLPSQVVRQASVVVSLSSRRKGTQVSTILIRKNHSRCQTNMCVERLTSDRGNVERFSNGQWSLLCSCLSFFYRQST